LTLEHLFCIITLMKAWQRFLSFLQPREPAPLFELDERLRLEVAELAARERRPPGEVQADLLAAAVAHRHATDRLWRRWQSLSPREQQACALACLGYTNRQIAARLGVAEETIKTHLRNALLKFDLHGKVELRLALAEWDFSGWD
jgi:DNA-binding CsgD family transcriptional regulator